MIGNKWVVKEDFCDIKCKLIKGEELIEKGTLNADTGQIEDGGIYNEIHHPKYGFICEAGSVYAKKHLELVQQTVV